MENTNPTEKLMEIRKRFGLKPPPPPSEETIKAMEHNRALNIEKYGDPLGYLFESDSDATDESEKESENTDPRKEIQQRVLAVTAAHWSSDDEYGPPGVHYSGVSIDQIPEEFRPSPGQGLDIKSQNAKKK